MNPPQAPDIPGLSFAWETATSQELYLLITVMWLFDLL
jgi:hypothetical protein